MGAFGIEKMNRVFDKAILRDLINSSKQMKEDCIKNCKPLKNCENKISNRLVEKYLKSTKNALFLYRRESSTGYNEDTDDYEGRADIEVISCDNFRDDKIYHVIECKRIDGSSDLNRKYVNEGISRFFTPVPLPKYPSFEGRSSMFGYVVKEIDIPANASTIDGLQHKMLQGLTVGNFVLMQKVESSYYVYACMYDSMHTGRVKLNHLFFNFADAMDL